MRKLELGALVLVYLVAGCHGAGPESAAPGGSSGPSAGPSSGTPAPATPTPPPPPAAPLLSDFQHHRNVTSVRFTPDGKQLLSIGKDGILGRWDVANGQLIEAIAFSPPATDRAEIFEKGGMVGFWNVQTLVFFDTATRAKVREEKVDMDYCVSPDGSFMTCRGDGAFHLEEVRSGKVLHDFDGGVPCFSPDQTIFALLGDDATTIEDARGNHRTHVDHVALIPYVHDLGADDATLVVSRSTIRVYDMGTNQLRAESPALPHSLESVHISPDLRTIVAQMSSSTEIGLYDATTGALSRTLRWHQANVRCARFSPDGSLLASSDEDGKLAIWDVKSGARLLPR